LARLAGKIDHRRIAPDGEQQQCRVQSGVWLELKVA